MSVISRVKMASAKYVSERLVLTHGTFEYPCIVCIRKVVLQEKWRCYSSIWESIYKICILNQYSLLGKKELIGTLSAEGKPNNFDAGLEQF
jgi:hypothetical protein